MRNPTRPRAARPTRLRARAPPPQPDCDLWTVPRCGTVCGMNKGLIWTIVGILLIIALVIWIMQRT